jgi:hypothetical protein
MVKNKVYLISLINKRQIQLELKIEGRESGNGPTLLRMGLESDWMYDVDG